MDFFDLDLTPPAEQLGSWQLTLTHQATGTAVDASGRGWPTDTAAGGTYGALAGHLAGLLAAAGHVRDDGTVDWADVDCTLVSVLPWDTTDTEPAEPLPQVETGAPDDGTAVDPPADLTFVDPEPEPLPDGVITPEQADADTAPPAKRTRTRKPKA